MSEFDAIRRIAKRAGTPPPGQVWIGDDAAVLEHGLLAATDAIVEGVDFLPEDELADTGWRAIAVNASDIAAMGGRPTAALVTVIGPEAIDIDALYDGVFEACGDYGCSVVGGDLSNGERLVVSVTMLGTTDGRPPVLRSGARPGDTVFSTGPLGHAAVHWYRNRPKPPVELGPVIAAAGATAMIDVSDGLGPDIGHILDASHVGAAIGSADGFSYRHPGATDEQVLYGGDDYVLLFTGPAELAEAIAAVPIGRIVSDPDTRTFCGQPIEQGGWEHRFR